METIPLKEAIRKAKEETQMNEKNTEKKDPSTEISIKYKKLQKDLLLKVKGQDNAIEKICRTLFNAELFDNQNSDKIKHPFASFFLFGAPGTGKTYTVETLAGLLDYPYMRFDMAAYSDQVDSIGLIGSDRQFRDAKAGNLTKFLNENIDQKHIVIFDEIEKAHKTTLDIFLPMLGSGELFDPYFRHTISLKNTIIFFTSNSGKDLYKDNGDVSNIPVSTLVDALEKDVDINGKRRLTAEFCSRIVSGTPIIFNNLKISDLIKIVEKVQKDVSDEIYKLRKIKLSCDKNLPLAFLYMCSAKDARIISNKYESYLKNKMFDVPFEKNSFRKIRFEIDYKTMPDEIKKLFIKNDSYNVVYVGNNENIISCLVKSKFNVNVVTDSSELNQALRKNVDLVLVDPLYGGVKDKLISVTDYNSKGINLFYELTETDSSLMVYILTNSKSMINERDKESLISDGARELICVDEINKFKDKIIKLCDDIYIENNIKKLSSKGWILDCKDSLKTEKTNSEAVIVLNKFRKYMDYDSDACKLMIKEDEKSSIKYSDIIGAANAKAELKYFAEYLKDPLNDNNRKLRVPKGILLYGPPGTGKTMLAKAMANEAGINYISLNGSDLVGETPNRGIMKIEEVFSSAKKYAPTIIFIDEIDAIAKKRIGFKDEAVLNALLTQMDGFKTNLRKPVFVIAATNFPIKSVNNSICIDEAILRRFDSRILVDLPNKKERIQFTELYLKKKEIKISKDIINTFGECTVNSSLAEIENIIELAVRNSIRSNCDISGDLLLEAYDEFFGGEKREQKQKEANQTAIHEAGHAVVSYLCGKLPSYITIESRAYYGGYVSYQEDSNSYYTRQDLINKIRMILAGRASEELFFKESGINSGSASDLKKATAIAAQIVVGFGMNDKLAVYDDNLNAEQKANIETILQEEYRNTVTLVKENKKTIRAIADELMKNGHLTGKEFKAIVKDIL